MIELTGIGPILRAIGLAYWLVALALLVFAFKKPATRKGKALAVATVVLLFGALPGSIVIRDALELRERRAKLATAMARFEELCKNSGEFIHRTAEDVEGVFLMRLRPSGYDPTNKYAIDPYGYDFDSRSKKPSIEGYAGSFLWARNNNGRLIENVEGATPGYRYVDLINPDDGKRYRYTAHMDIRPEQVGKTINEVFLMRSEQLPDGAERPRYGITYQDITAPADREMWIAASSLRVIDLEAGEVMGERIGYMIDRGQGSTASARAPWDWARNHGPACPHSNSIMQTRNFVEQVLKIREEPK